MIPIAFHAPLKPPDHPNPSGDRELARALMMALAHAGYTPHRASDLRSLDLRGDEETQTAIMARAEAEIRDLVERGHRENWRAWVTYHNYYKAPDLVGPAVARALGIAYVQVESTRARKRLAGPWARFAEAAEAAADAAQAILYFTARDAEALADYSPAGQRLVHLRPFLARTKLPPASDRSGPMLVAAMMRPGDKAASYRIVAETLAQLPGDWRLDVAGDGPAREEIAELMAPFGSRVRLLGRQDTGGMAELYRHARLLLWPGVNEAIGLVLLEAQAAGIPVITQDRPGLREVVAPGLPRPAPEAGAAALAQAIADPLPDAESLRAHVAAHHLLPAAAETLRATLDALT